jgi:hypothetical protein
MSKKASALYKGMPLKLADIVVGDTLGESDVHLQKPRARALCATPPPPPRGELSWRGDNWGGGEGGAMMLCLGMVFCPFGAERCCDPITRTTETCSPFGFAPLGTGTFSRVRIARHKASGKYMALKILKKVRMCPCAD